MARRGRGEGTIRYRESDGRWEASVTLGSQRKSFYGKTRREVTEKLRTAQRDYEQSQFIGDGRQTVEQFLRSWLETKAAEVKESTWRIYEMRVRVHIVPVIGKVKLSKLTAQQVQQVITTSLSGGLGGTSAGEVYGVLHQALQEAERLGLVARDVSARVKRPHGKRREMHPLALDEVLRLLEVSRGHWLDPLLRLALTTGMRQGELLALRWREVDLERQRLSVVVSLRYVHGEPRFSTPKTEHSRRQIALVAEMVAVLRVQRQQQRAWRLAAGPAWRGDLRGGEAGGQQGVVFCDELGFTLRPGRLVLQFKALLAAAGLPSIRFHDLRHTTATLALKRGVHPKVVSDLLGHASVSTTLNLYSHVLPDMQEDAARAIGGALNW
jgi:integrase